MINLDEIKKVCSDSQILELCLPVLDDPKFSICPLNLDQSLQCAFTGGLLYYTGELISSGALLCSLYKNYNKTHINVKEYLVSVIWANYGKCFEYDCVDTESNIWRHSQMTSKLETAYRSAIQFQRFIDSSKHNEAAFAVSYDNIIHNILSQLSQFGSTPESSLLLSVVSLSKNLYQYKIHEQ